MVTNMKFGKCLRFILSILDISIVRLSKAINVDSSLVNRWVNEKRIPSYNTNYIENISEYLTNCIVNSFQEQYLDELFLKVCDDNKIEINKKEKIKKILLQSQGYSVECKKKSIRENKPHLISNREVLKFMDNCQLISNDDNNFKINTIPSNTYNTDFSVNLSSEDKVIIGYKNVLSASISLLEDAAKHKCNDNVIYISFNSDLYITSPYDSDLVGFRNAAFKAISNGWNILLLLRLNNNINSIIKFIDFAQPLINTGKFTPYYFKKYDLFTINKEFIIVPETGALLGFSSSLHSGIDTAFYFKNKIAINILKNNFSTILALHTQSLVKYYTLDNAIEYSNRLTKLEDSIGNRILYKCDFSILILPENLYIKLLQRKNLMPEEMLMSLEFYKKRLKAFLSNIYNYKYTDIYDDDCINNLIKYRKLYLYCYNKVEIIDLKVQDVIELLKNIITLLEKYSNYNIAFVSQNSDNIIQNFSFFCEVKERGAVILEAYEHPKSIPEVRLSIEEPIFVKAFEVYFKEIWEQIAPINKDKKEIINWLKCQINLLRNYNKDSK